MKNLHVKSESLFDVQFFFSSFSPLCSIDELELITAKISRSTVITEC